MNYKIYYNYLIINIINIINIILIIHFDYLIDLKSICLIINSLIISFFCSNIAWQLYHILKENAKKVKNEYIEFYHEKIVLFQDH